PASVPDGAVLHNLLPQQVQALPLPHERLEHLYSLSPMQQAYGLGVGDTVLQKTPFSFDVSVWEFFWPLMSGARLVV
ncbi:hypothetical protein K4W96_00075, partial [Pseudomonas aeruginosa]|uniref:hypothetical protein n=1 Tax=Pseudomonas aeruginosa TaxID=287 RepID=UPI002A0933D7|nr:hypothetical protein [Pseudomonas aeruginosa]